MSKIVNTESFEINSTKTVINLSTVKDVELHYIYTANPFSLSANVSILEDNPANIVDGFVYNILFEGHIATYTGFTINFFGTSLTELELNATIYITATYINGTWKVEKRYFCCGNPISGGNISPGTLNLGEAQQDYSGTLRTLPLGASGTIITSDGSNNKAVVPTDINQILVSDGGGVSYYPVTGDIQQLSPGALTLKDASIGLNHLSFTPNFYLIATQILTFEELSIIGTPITVITAFGKQIVPQAVSFYLEAGGVAFDTIDLNIGFELTALYTIPGSIVSSSSGLVYFPAKIASSFTPFTDLSIWAPSNFTTGNGTITIKIIYALL